MELLKTDKITAWAIPGIKECYRTYYTPAQVAEMIINKVCAFYDIEPCQVKKKCRLENIVLARRFCMYFIRQKTSFSLKQTGQLFNGFDHTSVIYSTKLISEKILMKGYSPIRDDYQKLLLIIY